MGNTRQLLWVGELAQSYGIGYIWIIYINRTLTHTSSGNLLLKRMVIAIPQAIKTTNDFRRFDTRLRLEKPKEVELMEKELADREGDQTKADPYQVPRSSESMDNGQYLLN